METSSVYLLFLLSLLHICYAKRSVSIAKTTNTNRNGQVSSNSPTLLVTVDGKSYFVDDSVKRNWAEAKEYCIEFGMKLADITSSAQYEALDAAYSPTNFKLFYWTSGRDIQQIQQFVWDTSGTVISDKYRLFACRTEVEYHTCVYFHSRPNLNASYASFYYSYDKLGTLCQT